MIAKKEVLSCVLCRKMFIMGIAVGELPTGTPPEEFAALLVEHMRATTPRVIDRWLEVHALECPQSVWGKPLCAN